MCLYDDLNDLNQDAKLKNNFDNNAILTEKLLKSVVIGCIIILLKERQRVLRGIVKLNSNINWQCYGKIREKEKKWQATIYKTQQGCISV